MEGLRGPCMWLLLLTSSALLGAASGVVTVNSIATGASNGKAGTGGGVPLTIKGSNLKEAFKLTGVPGDNTIVQLSATDQMSTHNCTLNMGFSAQDGTSLYVTTSRAPAGWYNVMVTVDGANATHTKPSIIELLDSYTPTVESVVVFKTLGSYVGKGGQEFVRICGRIFTSYLNGTEFGIRNSTNGITARLVAAYADQYLCDKNDVNAKPLPIFLNGANGESKDGCFTVLCHPKDVGNHNLTYIVGEEFGRSVANCKLFHHDRNNVKGIWETYPRIFSMDLHAGSTGGGTDVTLLGFMGSSASDIYVKVEGTNATIKSRTYDKTSTQTTLVFTTPAEPTHSTYRTGGRGVKFESWDQTSAVANIAAADAVVTAGSPTDVEQLDSSNAKYTGAASYVVGRLSFYYMPVSNGSYDFYMTTCNDAAATPAVFTNATLRLSQTTMDPTAKADLFNGDRTFDSTTTSTAGMQTLTAGKAYYMEAVFYGTKGACVNISVFTCNTVFNNGVLCSAVNQREQIAVSSTVVTETQVIDFTNWPAAGGTTNNPKHIYTVTGPTAGAKFRLCVAKSCTVVLQMPTATDMQEALSDVATLATSEVVTVTLSGNVYTVEIETETGPVLLEIVDENLGASTGTVVDPNPTVQPSGLHWVFKHGNYRSLPIPQRSTAAKTAEAIAELFSVRCNKAIPPAYSTSSMFYHEDYESLTWSCEEEPFCGAKSYSTLNGHIDLYNKKQQPFPAHTTATHVGFAYRMCGCDLQPWLYYRANVITDSHNFTWWRSINVSTLVSDCEYHYYVHDLKAQILTDHDTWIATGTESSVKAWVDIVRVHRNDRCADPRARISVDEVFVGLPNNNIDITDQKLRTVPPLRAKVTATSVADVYTVKIEPCDCKIPSTLALEGVTTAANAWVGSVTASPKASPPVAGTFDLTLGSKTITVPVTISERNLRKEIESNFDVGTVDVERIGRWDCANFKFQITYLTRSGCQTPFTVSSSSLTGNTPAISAALMELGGHHDTISGSFTAVPQTATQVQVYVDEWLPAWCDDDVKGNCTFTYSAALEPTIATVAPTSGKAGDTLTIVGTVFDGAVPANNMVTIGTASCTVTAATTTQLTCTLGAGTAGTHPVHVYVQAKGKARATASPAATFTYTLTIASIGPTHGSIVGCTLLTVTGDGYDATATVTVGGVNCPIADPKTDITQTTIKCQVPSKGSAGAVDVVVTVGGASATHSSFTYDASATYTPTISSPTSTTTANAWGGESLTITGTGFGTTAPEVTVGTKKATVVTHSDTSIVVTLPALPQGVHSIKVFVSNKGCAAASGALPTVTVSFTITQVCPTVCSAYGGCTFTIQGQGTPFPAATPEAHLEVKVGSTSCQLTAASTTSQLVCKLDRVTKIHQVNYKGDNNNHRWEPRHVDVDVGDCIKWKWKANPLTYHQIRVQQIDSASAPTKTTNGFESAASETGSYTWCFSQTATLLYYWSTPIDRFKSISFSGTVTVMARTAQTAKLAISVKGDATVSPLSPTLASCTNPAVCPAAIGTCGSAGTGLDITMDPCYSPTITNLAVSTPTYVPIDLTITGSNFGTSQACTAVSVGDYACSVPSTVTATSIVAQLAGSNPIKPGQHAAEVTFSHGYALFAGDQSLRYIAVTSGVDTVSHAAGSIAGGTDLTIGGKALNHRTAALSIHGVVCVQDPAVPATYNEIKCRTGAYIAAAAAPISVLLDGQQPPCKTTCPTFTYSPTVTPTVSSISPTTVAAAQTVSIAGTNFGSDTTKVEVKLGAYACTPVLSCTPTLITCTAPALPAISNQVSVRIDNQGHAPAAAAAVAVQGLSSVTSVSPNTGSIHGGLTTTVAGNGFDPAGTVVVLNSKPCSNVNVLSPAQLTCVTPANAAGAHALTVTTPSGFSAGPVFTYASANTPTLSTLNGVTAVTAGVAGTPLTLAGADFSAVAADHEVLIGAVPCTTPSLSGGNIECTAGANLPGTYDVTVNRKGWGLSNTLPFTYQLSLSAVSPADGSTAGGTWVTLTGNGLSCTAQTTLTVCGLPCTDCKDVTGGAMCKTPAHAAGQCDVAVTYGSTTRTLTNAFTYAAAKTPDISGLSHRRGGTAGGVSLTIAGLKFGTDCTHLTVTIDGINCTVTGCNDTAVVCVTGPVPKTVSWTTRCTDAFKTAKQNVQVHRHLYGLATLSMALNNKPDFQYVDVWSSVYTWGGTSAPTAGDLVVIPAGQAILLDTQTPILKLLLIQGCLIFEDAGTPTLQAEYILITDGGLLQVGTEDEPFCTGRAKICLQGNPRTQELPIYGSKGIGIRNGSLELHGCPTVTWTVLKDTAAVGATSINLNFGVPWSVGDKIIIATTGDFKSQKETEKRTISAISTDGKTITLDKPLLYVHYAQTETFADTSTFRMEASVGLLSRTIVVTSCTSSLDPSVVIPACPADFNPDRFATQTCFQGRFGEEVGSTEFGVQILFSPAARDSGEAVGHLEYTEITDAGQAYRLGRYPVHFHNMGDTSSNGECNCTDNKAGSYVRGCSIHLSFNRAINIHGTRYVLVEYNVVYDIMGGAFFLEDGVETCNIIRYNLIVAVKPSSSLQVDDLTPAAFWITNPNNCVNHNHAMGNYGFGYWYRMEKKALGSNIHVSTNPQCVQLLQFYNNTACHNGRYGLWVFEFYFPKPGPAVFDTFTACCNLRGFESGDTGLIQLVNSVLVHNHRANVEMLLNLKEHVATSLRYDRVGGFAIINCRIIGQLSFHPSPPTILGLVLPLDSGLSVYKVTFINFNCGASEGFKSSAIGLVKITCTCRTLCGAYEYRFAVIGWVNTACKARIEYEHQFALVDLDGSLTASTTPARVGVVGNTVVPNSDLLPANCVRSVTEWSIGGDHNGTICPAVVKFVKFNFNTLVPGSLEYKRVFILNQHGYTVIVWRKLSRDYAKGYYALLPVYKKNDTSNPCMPYVMWFENGEHLSNISYKAQYTGLQDTCVIMSHNGTHAKDTGYDRVKVLEKNNPVPGQSTVALSSQSQNGQWTYDNSTKVLSYQISAGPNHQNVLVHLSAENCLFVNCTPPADAATQPPTDTRPASVCSWSQTSTWGTSGTCGSWLTSAGAAGGAALPTAGAKVTITDGGTGYTVLDVTGTMPCFESIVVKKGATLEVEPTNDVHICATYIVVEGGGRLIIGREGTPATGEIKICLKGQHTTSEFPTRDGPNIGAKVLAVFGGLDMHGSPRGPPWVYLTATANRGDNELHISHNVLNLWKVDDEVVIAPTGYSAWHTETFKITAIDAAGTKLTLNTTLVHKHLAYSDSACKGTAAGGCVMAAEVGLLTRNIKIVGHDDGKLFSQSFGGRVLVGLQTDFTTTPATSARGYARISNVEFDRCGQEGYTEKFDPRCALAYVSTGLVSDVRPSYIRSNAFHEGLGQGICVYDASNFTITDNVVHHTVGQGLKTDARDVTVKGNLVVLSIWPGAYQDRKETTNKNLEGCLEVNQAVNVILQDNAVAGCERIGYRIDGESCYVASVWRNNTAHSGTIGAAIIPPLVHADVQDGFPGENCSKISGFRVWRQWGFGSYTQTGQSIVVADSMFCENSVSVFNMIVGPDIKAHQYALKTILIEDCTFVGRVPTVGTTQGFDCVNDKPDTSPGGADADNINLAGVFVTRCKNEGMTGICSLFSTAGNLFPFKPIILAKKQPAMYGTTYVNRMCAAHFNVTCPTRGRDTVLSYNKLSKDMDFPIRLSQIKLDVNVDPSSKTYVQYPDSSTAKAEQCGTLACDGPRKFIVKDTDGTFIGCQGALIPNADYQWGGDTSFGLGDYRLPNSLTIDVYGNKLNTSAIYNLRGIFGTKEGAPWDSISQTYKVCGLDYEWFATESMDSDSKTRLISPSVLISKNCTTKFSYALITAESSDAGICGGYPCMERPQYQWFVIATGLCYDVFYTGTPPQTMRIHFPYTSQSQSFQVCIFNPIAQRLDVYVLTDKERYILPVNGYWLNGAVTRHAKNTHQFKLSVSGNATGANLFDYDTKMQCIIVRGPDVIIIKTSPAIQFKSGISMTIDAFFGNNIVANLALFLGIPAHKVKVVSIVSAAGSGSSGRRRRAIDEVEVIIQITDSPPEGGDTQTLDYAALTNMYNILVEGFQTGTLAAALGNVTFTYLKLSPPIPADGTQAWADLLAQAAKSGVPLDGESTIRVPHSMQQYDAAVAGYEGGPFIRPPAVRILDPQLSVVPVLVTNGLPWKVTARLHNYNGQSTLTGSTTIPFTNGWAIFSDIILSDPGTYTLEFELAHPTSFNNIRSIVSSTPVVVTKRPLSLHPAPTTATVSEAFTLHLAVQDPSGAVVTDLNWKGHTWTFSLRLHSAFSANLAGNLTGNLDSNGLTTTNKLTLDKTGYFAVEVLASSKPVGYDLQGYAIVHVLPANFSFSAVETTATLSITVDANHSVLVQPGAFKAHLANKLQTLFGAASGTLISNITIVGTGPYTVSFVVSGTAAAVNSSVRSLGAYVNESCPALTWLTVKLTCSTLLVNGTPHNATPAPATPKPTPADITLPLVLGICVPVGVILLIVIAVVCVLKRGNTKGKAPPGVVSGTPEPGHKAGALPQFTSQSGLLSSRASSMVSTNPAGRAPDQRSFSSTDSSANSSPSLGSTSGLLSNRSPTPHDAPSSAAAAQRAAASPNTATPPTARPKSGWKNRLSLSRGTKKSKPLQVTPRGQGPTPPPADYTDPPPPTLHSEDSACSQSSKQGVTVAYSPREISFNMSDVS